MNELRRRVALLAAAAVGLAVALTALAGFLVVRQQLLAQVDNGLLDRVRGAVASPLGDPAVISRLPAAALGADVRFVLLTAQGQAFTPAGSGVVPTPGPPELAVAQRVVPQSVRTIDVAGAAYRVVAVPAAPGFALLLAQSTAPTEAVLTRLGVVSAVVGGIGVVLAAWAGLAVATAGLRPVERVSAAAERVAATGRLDPIEVPGRGELARLAAAFNAMLAALSASQERQRRLVADAGHELRTPLTSLRTNLDLLAQSERPGAAPLPATERTALLHDVREQVAELSALVSDLVELARDEPPEAAPELLDLAEVVRRALARVRRRASDVQFAVDLRPWTVLGDAALLERAVTNLLDNAAKWSPDGGVVEVLLRDGTLSVADEGPGIADEDLPYVFERFWRASEARGRPGSGLGLAIVAQAAARHGGSVTAARSTRGGALLVLHLPPAPAAVAGARLAEGAAPVDVLSSEQAPGTRGR